MAQRPTAHHRTDHDGMNTIATWDSDVRAIVAYWSNSQADQETRSEIDLQNPLPAQYGPTVTGVRYAAHDKVAYGRYLATALGHCMDCPNTVVNGRQRH